MLDRIGTFVSLWGRGAITGLHLGRKSDNLLDEVRQLETCIDALKGQIDPYSTVPVRVGVLKESGGAYKPLDASRLNFGGPLGDWKVERFLGPQYWLPFQEPALLRKAGLQPGSWAWPRCRPCGAAEELALFRKWDSAGVLELADATDPPYLVSSVFNVYKDADRDRQIIDRRGRNGAEATVAPGPSRELPSGAQLTDLLVSRGEEQVVVSGCDRKDFYHHFEVSESRTRSNVTGLPHAAELFEDFPSRPLERFRARLAAQPGPRETSGDRLGFDVQSPPAEGSSLPAQGLTLPAQGLALPAKVRACFATAPMGDHLMVDVALDSHANLLRSSGVLDDSRRILGRRAVPDTTRVEALVIDDWMTAERVSLASSSNRAEASRLAYDRAQAGYLREGLPGSTSKDFVASELCTTIGAEVDSRRGLAQAGLTTVGAPLE